MAAARESATEREHGRRHATDGRIERVNELENFKRARQRNLPSAGNICSRAKAVLSGGLEHRRKADKSR